jgi:F-type H+-transporting ATPase subunit delta
MQLKFAPRYAKALIEIATESNEIEAVYNDMKLIAETIASHSELHNMVKSPVVYGDNKLSVLNQVFSSTTTLTKTFIATTISKKREIHLLEIANEFVAQYNTINNIIKATYTTAQPADEATLANVKQSVKTQLNATSVELTTIVDESIIGGFILQYGDKIFDASIRYDLNQIAKQFEGNAYVAKV